MNDEFDEYFNAINDALGKLTAHEALKQISELLEDENNFRLVGILLALTFQDFKDAVGNNKSARSSLMFTLLANIASSFHDAKTSDAEIINAMISQRLMQSYNIIGNKINIAKRDLNEK